MTYVIFDLCIRDGACEDINDLLTALLGLSFPHARTFWGLLTRLSAKVAACNLIRFVYHLYERPNLAHISFFTI